MSKITVYPLSENALNIKHPSDGPLVDTGSAWNNDGFTARMITDGAITADKDKAFKSEKPKPDLSKPPAHATYQDENGTEPIPKSAGKTFTGPDPVKTVTAPATKLPS